MHAVESARIPHRGRRKVLVRLAFVAVSTLGLSCATQSPQLRFEASYYSFEELLKELRRSWKDFQPVVHAEVTGLVLGHWALDADLAAAELPALMEFAQAEGIEGIDGLYWTSVTAALQRDPEAVKEAAALALRLSKAAQGSEHHGADFAISLADLSRDRAWAAVLVLPDSARASVLATVPTLEDQLITQDLEAQDLLPALGGGVFGQLRQADAISLYGDQSGNDGIGALGHVIGGARGGFAAKAGFLPKPGSYMGRILVPSKLGGNRLSPNFSRGSSVYQSGSGGTTVTFEPGAGGGGRTVTTTYSSEDRAGNTTYRGFTVFYDPQGNATGLLIFAGDTGADGTSTGESEMFVAVGGQWVSTGSSSSSESESQEDEPEEPESEDPEGPEEPEEPREEDEESEDDSSGATEAATPEDEKSYPLPDDVGGADLPPLVRNFQPVVIPTLEPWINPGPDYAGGVGFYLARVKDPGNIDPSDDDLIGSGPTEFVPPDMSWYFGEDDDEP